MMINSGIFPEQYTGYTQNLNYMKKYAIIGSGVSKQITKGLIRHDIEPVKLPGTELIEKPLTGHADLQVFLCRERIFCHPDIDRSFLKRIEPLLEIVICKTSLSKKYPLDIPYNIADTGKSVICARKYMDPEIMDYLRVHEREFVDVRQGYAKCSTMIVSEHAIITSDPSIHGAAVKSGITSLKISTGHISLPGYNHGFIGGASGMWGEHIYITGDITDHPDYRNIIEFIECQGGIMVCLSDERAADIGSILIFES